MIGRYYALGKKNGKLCMYVGTLLLSDVVHMISVLLG